MKLYNHQRELLDKNPAKWLLAFECGTGKTLTAINLVKKNTDNCLIVCPKSIKQQWLDELKKQLCNQHKWLVYTKEEFKKSIQIKNIHNYNALIIDEAHNFSGMQGYKKKSGMLKSLLQYIKDNNPLYIYLLTATPYLSTPYNIYALAEILGHKWNYRQFTDTFFSKVNMGLRWPVPVIKKKINWRGKIVSPEEVISDLVNMLGNTIKMEECIDIPEQIYQTEYFDLTAEQNQTIKLLDDSNSLVYWTKVHQICGGTLKSDGYNEDKFFKSEKLERLLELCKEHNKLIIVCRYNNEINYIKNKIIDNGNKNKIIDNGNKNGIYVINGATNNKNSIIQTAEASEKAIVIVNASCSEGYELPSFPIMIFYSYDFSLKNYIQIKGRIQRINNIKKNVYLSLIVKKTIDEEVYKNIQNKCDFDIAIYDKKRTRIYNKTSKMD